MMPMRKSLASFTIRIAVVGVRGLPLILVGVRGPEVIRS